MGRGERAGAGTDRVKALATTSAGFAWTLGRADNQVTLGEVLEHLRVIVDAVQVPVNADFEGGFAVDPQQVGANVKLAAAHRQLVDPTTPTSRQRRDLPSPRTGQAEVLGGTFR